MSTSRRTEEPTMIIAGVKLPVIFLCVLYVLGETLALLGTTGADHFLM